MISGALERIEPLRACGWAVSEENPEDKLLIEIFVGGRLRGSAWANLSDGEGEGEAGAGNRFLVEFASALKLSAATDVEVYATAIDGERARLDGAAAQLAPSQDRGHSTAMQSGTDDVHETMAEIKSLISTALQHDGAEAAGDRLAGTGRASLPPPVFAAGPAAFYREIADACAALKQALRKTDNPELPQPERLRPEAAASAREAPVGRTPQARGYTVGEAVSIIRSAAQELRKFNGGQPVEPADRSAPE